MCNKNKQKDSLVCETSKWQFHNLDLSWVLGFMYSYYLCVRRYLVLSDSL